MRSSEGGSERGLSRANALISAVVVSAALSAAIWALSATVTGQDEPWDAETPYYFIALMIAGALSGALIPKHLWAHYVGAVLGQAAYEVAFLKLGPLFILGLVFLAGFSIIFVVAAAVGGSLRRRLNSTMRWS